MVPFAFPSVRSSLPSTFGNSNMQNKLLETAYSKLPDESAGNSLKTALWIILGLVFFSCCIISLLNGFDTGKMLETNTLKLLFSINSLTIIGMSAALAFGVHSAGKKFKTPLTGGNNDDILFSL